MISIPNAVKSIVEADAVLQTGMGKGLLNLTAVARQIRPLVEARSHKTVSLQAVAMALSRLSQASTGHPEKRSVKPYGRLSIQLDLAAVTLVNHQGLMARVAQMLPDLRPTGSSSPHCTLTQGERELMVLADVALVEGIARAFTDSRPSVRSDLGAVSLELPGGAVTRSGTLYRLLEPIAMQGIPVVEVASTTTEFHVYLAASDVMLAADSIHHAYFDDRAGR